MNNENEYSIDCTRDVCLGDEVQFEKAIFSPGKWNGRFKKPGEFLGTETIKGKIIKDSYGKDKQQHTFTIQTNDNIIRIKGRNLYRNECKRKPWIDESKRKEVLEDKHKRGSIARELAKERKSNKILQNTELLND